VLPGVSGVGDVDGRSELDWKFGTHQAGRFSKWRRDAQSDRASSSDLDNFNFVTVVILL
jgi:hypothetical protein